MNTNLGLFGERFFVELHGETVELVRYDKASALAAELAEVKAEAARLAAELTRERSVTAASFARVLGW
jgi:uncharacterized protein GlcG (DUF336 family)